MKNNIYIFLNKYINIFQNILINIIYNVISVFHMKIINIAAQKSNLDKISTSSFLILLGFILVLLLLFWLDSSNSSKVG